MRYSSVFCALWFFFGGLFSGSTLWAADLIGESSFAEVVSVAQQFGEAKLVTEKGNEPYFEGKINDILYSGLFRDCNDEHSACTTLTLRAVYEVEGAQLPKINEHNDTTKCGKLYLSDNNQYLVFDYFLTLEGGLSQTNLKSAFEWFVLGLKDVNQVLSNGQSLGHRLGQSILEKARERLR